MLEHTKAVIFDLDGTLVDSMWVWTAIEDVYKRQMMIVDAVSRLIPGVLHNDVSAEFESFQDNLLEYPQYSRPEIWHDRQVPPILLSGHHANVEKWRREQSVIRTAKWRPDLLEDAELTMKERELAEEIIENREKDLKNEE